MNLLKQIDVVADYLLVRNITAWMMGSAGDVASDWMLAGPFSFGEFPGQLHAILVLLGHAVVMLGLAFWLFQRRDVAAASPVRDIAEKLRAVDYDTLFHKPRLVWCPRSSLPPTRRGEAKRFERFTTGSGGPKQSGLVEVPAAPPYCFARRLARNDLAPKVLGCVPTSCLSLMLRPSPLPLR